jgi:predicted phosphate transport protein (TIGR00153 family)
MELTKNMALFRRTKALETEIDEFLDKLSESALVFRQAIELYLADGPGAGFDERLRQVNELESRADGLRRGIETQLYAQTLIPESRGDVLGLLENLDSILNLLEGTLWGFSIETPNIPEEFVKEYRELTEMAVLSVESIVMASRAFFRDHESVGDHMYKVMFYEKEADKVSTKLKRAIFGQAELHLSQKIHLKSFTEHIDNVADMAEDVADRLSIYAIKRSI